MTENVRSMPRTGTAPAVGCSSISTLRQIRSAMATGGWPSKDLARRAGAVAATENPSALVGLADGRYARAARLWLQIAYFLDDGEQLVAALCLAAQCATRAGNYSFAHNCMRRADAAARQHHLDPPPAMRRRRCCASSSPSLLPK